MTAYIGLGSNLGDRAVNLRGAIERLSRVGVLEAVSSVYETKPWGVAGYQPRYLNQVVAVKTNLDPLDVVTELLGIEHSLGRTRTEKNTSRTLDLDLLLWGDSIVDASGVCVPHKRLHERAFVLIPLAEIAPGLVHPVLGVTIFDLAENVDSTGVSPMR
ncbi:MAG: 2-amino-4-hydroxy-6-hydroxymethyldihydropteridine diphosphokinase [Chloroflexi bacterium]|nr:2-amino-4-hydroxy-6-hydroxymethyldihydropteridine diphosphokinase [Chloroflexota bacterium]